MRSGVVAATSSMSIPPAGLTITTGRFETRSMMMPTYDSAPMSAASATSTRCTTRPLIDMPRIRSAAVAGLCRRLREFDTARLPAPARVYLGFDHDCAVSPACDGFGFVGRGRHLARLHRDAGLSKQFLRLVLVNIHVLGLLDVGCWTLEFRRSTLDVPPFTCSSQSAVARRDGRGAAPALSRPYRT